MCWGYGRLRNVASPPIYGIGSKCCEMRSLWVYTCITSRSTPSRAHLDIFSTYFVVVGYVMAYCDWPLLVEYVMKSMVCKVTLFSDRISACILIFYMKSAVEKFPKTKSSTAALSWYLHEREKSERCIIRSFLQRACFKYLLHAASMEMCVQLYKAPPCPA